MNHNLDINKSENTIQKQFQIYLINMYRSTEVIGTLQQSPTLSLTRSG